MTAQRIRILLADDHPVVRDGLEEAFRVNVTAPIALVQEVLPLIEASGGLIINISSDAALGGYPGWGGYGLTKAALDLASLTLANELSGRGVGVVSVDPGDLRTRMHQEAFPGDDISDPPLPPGRQHQRHAAGEPTGLACRPRAVPRQCLDGLRRWALSGGMPLERREAGSTSSGSGRSPGDRRPERPPRRPPPGPAAAVFVRVEGDLREAMKRVGTPIRCGYLEPPYPPIEVYQTVFSRVPGSAEMPSAGRPFTARLVDALRAREIDLAEVTLHTGVSSHELEADDIEEQVLYAEPFEVPRRTAEAVTAARREGRPVIAVGTTVVRALESAWDGDRVREAPGFTRL